MKLGRNAAFGAVLTLAVVAACKPKATADVPTSGPVKVVVDADGFAPSHVTFKKGAPASLVFTRTTDETCATQVVFPDLGITKDLPKGSPVTIDVPTDKPQNLTFQCGMGMYRSAVVIQ
jgi:plastocyanin domain-containing protein